MILKQRKFNISNSLVNLWWQLKKKKKLAEVFGIFESLLTQNPPNQDSQLSWFFQSVWKTISKSKIRGLQENISTWKWFQNLLHKTFDSFIVLQTFKVKLLLQNSLWKNFLIYLKTNVTPSNALFFHFAQYSTEEVRVLINLIFLILGRRSKSSNAARNHIFLYFWAAIMDFLKF